MTDTDVDDFLEHFGVKGMRWGVRKSKTESSKENAPKTSHKKRNVALVLGGVAVASALVVGAVYAKKHMGVSIKDIPKPATSTTNFAKALAHEPVGIMHSSRGHGRGYTFLRDGGMKHPGEEFIKAGLDQADIGFFKRYGEGKTAARFADPLGRKDQAGRLIGHDVILPKSMAGNANSADDIAKIAWPTIKDLFNPYYRSEIGTLGPGF